MMENNIKARGRDCGLSLSLSPRTRERRFDGKFARGNIFSLHFFGEGVRVLPAGARERARTRARRGGGERELRPRAQF